MWPRHCLSTADRSPCPPSANLIRWPSQILRGIRAGSNWTAWPPSRQPRLPGNCLPMGGISSTPCCRSRTRPWMRWPPHPGRCCSRQWCFSRPVPPRSTSHRPDCSPDMPVRSVCRRSNRFLNQSPLNWPATKARSNSTGSTTFPPRPPNCWPVTREHCDSMAFARSRRRRPRRWPHTVGRSCSMAWSRSPPRRWRKNCSPTAAPTSAASDRFRPRRRSGSPPIPARSIWMVWPRRARPSRPSSPDTPARWGSPRWRAPPQTRPVSTPRRPSCFHGTGGRCRSWISSNSRA